MKTYLVTGGAGFIGSHLCESLLKSGNKVINIDNFNNFYDEGIKIKNVLESLNLEKIDIKLEKLKDKVDSKNYSLEIVDIRDIESLENIFKENNIHTIVHLAAMAGVRPSIEDPLLYEEVNVKGTMNILEMCKRYNVKKFVCASSSSVYGNNKRVPFKETDIVDFAISPYAATKKSCEVMAHVYKSLYNIDTVMLRFFTVYGPRQRPDLAIHKFAKIISNGENLPFYGDGTAKRDYTYIEDIINGILKSIDFVEKNENVYEIFNLGESQTISLSEMVAAIEKELGKANIIKMPMQPGDVEQTFADISKAREMIAYDPKTKFDEGIKKFIEWFKNK